MALSWLSALKAVPWSDVVQAAPNIVQGARKLFTAAKSYATSGDSAAAASSARDDDLGARVQRIEAGMKSLHSEQRSSADLIRSLAEQNANIVAALDLMRRRMRVLLGVCIVLVILLAVLALAVVVK